MLMKMWQDFPLAHGKGTDLALSTTGRTTLKGEVPHSTQCVGAQKCGQTKPNRLDLWPLGILSPRRAWVQPPCRSIACLRPNFCRGPFPIQICRQDFTRNHLRQTSISVVSQMLLSAWQGAKCFGRAAFL